MFKKFVYSILFILILFASLIGAGYALRPKDSDVCINQIKDFHSIEDDSLDAIIYGSSHGWLGFDATEFEKQTNLRTYNYSCYWQSFNTTWLFFHDSLLSQKPKVVFLDASRINDILEGLGLEGQSYYTRHLKWSKYKVRYLKQCFGNSAEGILSYIFPIIKFHTKWENVEEIFRKTDKTRFIDTNGCNLSPGVLPVEKELIGAKVGEDEVLTAKVEQLNEYEGGEVGQCEIGPQSIQLMNDITDICNKQGIRLIWYVTPYVGDYNYDTAMKEYVQKNGGEYVNLFECLDDIGFDSKTDMYDADHLNKNGAKKVALYFAKYIRQE